MICSCQPAGDGPARIAASVVHFHRIEGVAGWSLPHWQAMLFPDDGGWSSRPFAVAYVTEFAGEAAALLGCPALLDYLIVFDDRRGEGHARTLLRAIHARWPGIRHTGRLGGDGGFRPGH